MTGLIIVNIILSIFIGIAGSNRKIGFGGAFIISLFFSALIGLIVTMLSKSNEDVAKEKELLDIQKETLAVTKQKATGNIIEDLTKLKDLKDSGILTEDEFLIAKKQILISGTLEEIKPEQNNDKPVKPVNPTVYLSLHQYRVNGDDDFGDDLVKVISSKAGISKVTNESGEITKFVKTSDVIPAT